MSAAPSPGAADYLPLAAGAAALLLVCGLIGALFGLLLPRHGGTAAPPTAPTTTLRPTAATTPTVSPLSRLGRLTVSSATSAASAGATGRPGASTSPAHGSTGPARPSSENSGPADSGPATSGSATRGSAPVVAAGGPVGAGPFADFPRSGNAFQMSGGIWGSDPTANHFRLTAAQGLSITAAGYSYGTPGGGLRITVRFPAQPGQTGENDFTVEVRAPEGQKLQVGKRYDNATRAAFATSGPGVDISGNGQGNNTLVGSFRLTRLEYDGYGRTRVVEGWALQHPGGSPCVVQFRVISG